MVIKKKSQSPLQKLPDDLTLIILSYLQIPDVFALFSSMKTGDIVKNTWSNGAKQSCKTVKDCYLKGQICLCGKPREGKRDKSCSVCFDKKITKSTAMTTYLIPASVLDTLECTLIANPHYRSAAKMQLYSEKDVVRHAVALYGSLDGLNLEIIRRQHKKQQRKTKKEEKETMRRDSRVTLLTNALLKYGLTLRSDSRLCSNFIDGDSTLTVEAIADVMHEMNWYFTATNYRIIRDDVWSDEAASGDYYDNEEISDTAKSIALSNWRKLNQTAPITQLPRLVQLRLKRLM